MRLGAGVNKLYRGAVLSGAAMVTDAQDGRGERITYWNSALLGPMPSLEDIEAAGLLAEQETAAERTDKSTLRGQIIGATEAKWLALTEVQRQKVILKALKYMARNL